MLTGEKLGAALATAIQMKGVSKADVARHFDVKPPSIQGWLKNGRISKTHIEKLLTYFSDVVGPDHWGITNMEMAAFGPSQASANSASAEGAEQSVVRVRPIKAWDDGDPIDDDEVEVMRLDLKLSAGSGRLQWEIDEKGARNRFRKSWCSKKGFKPECLTTLMVDGDSMYPTLVHGASVTVNTADTTIRNGKVYALDYQGEFLVKRLFVEPGNVLLIVSDNSDKTRFKDIVVPPEHADSVRVLAKVVSQSSDVD